MGRLAEWLAGGTTLLAAWSWNRLGPDKAYHTLFASLGAKGVMALLSALLIVAVYSIARSVILARKVRSLEKEKPLHERFVAVQGKDYMQHPENGKPVCQFCVAAGKVSYLGMEGNKAFLCHTCHSLVAE